MSRKNHLKVLSLVVAELLDKSAGDQILASLLNLASQRKAEEDIEVALSDLGVLAVRLNANGQLVGFNGACEETMGCTLSQVDGQYFWDVFFIPEEVDRVRHAIQDRQPARSPRSFDNCWVTRTGERRLVRWSHAATANDSRLVLGLDITDRVLVDGAAASSVFFDQTQDAVIMRDLEDRILLWNRAAERLYGWRASEAIGQNIYELLSQRNVDGSEEVVPAENEEWVGELHQLTKDQRDIIVESRWKFMYDEADQPKAVLMTNTDITEKKMLECQFLRGQRLESIGKLASGIAHDLNNVLSPMLLAIHLLQKKHNDEETQLWLERLRNSTHHAGHLITQLLSFARGKEEDRHMIQAGHLVEEAVEFLRVAFPKSIEIRTVVASDLWTIIANPTHLHQVAINLCVNARDAMPNGGKLSIELKNVVFDGDDIPVAGARPGRYVLVTVSDTGSGIPADIMDKMFEPFFTTKKQNKGTGLGLFTVLRIVKAHKGYITVASKTGKGAEFRIFLPAAESPHSDHLFFPPNEGTRITVVSKAKCDPLGRRRVRGRKSVRRKVKADLRS